MNRFQVVATDPEQILNLTMDRQQSLGVGHRFESANLAFFLSCVLVRDLSSVVSYWPVRCSTEGKASQWAAE